MKFLFWRASCLTASSMIPVSPTTGFNVLLISYCGSSCLKREGQSQKSLCVSSCWWISRPDFSSRVL